MACRSFRIFKVLVKIFILGLVCFVGLCAVFVALPSPTAPESQIISDLLNGTSVRRAYNTDIFHPWSVIRTPGFRSNFVLEWSYTQDTQTLYINQQQSIQFDRDEVAHVETGKILVVTADPDGITLPRFNKADATLLKFWMEGMVVPFRAQVVRRVISATPTYDIFAAPTDDVSKLRPLLTIKYGTDSSQPTFIFPLGPDSISPSKTLPVRQAILTVLVPLAYMGMGVIGAVIYVAFIVFNVAKIVGLMLVLWLVIWIWHNKQRADNEIASAPPQSVSPRSDSGETGNNAKKDAEKELIAVDNLV